MLRVLFLFAFLIGSHREKQEDQFTNDKLLWVALDELMEIEEKIILFYNQQRRYMRQLFKNHCANFIFPLIISYNQSIYLLTILNAYNYLMDLILEQAKQYFVAQQYEAAYKIFQDHEAEISKENLSLALDLAGCSLFMMRKFQEARLSFSTAIIYNPYIADFYINLGASLRSLQIEEQAINILDKASSMKIDPAINYNLRMLSKRNEQKIAQTQLISQNEEINPLYDKYGGLVPSFLKSESARSDCILAEEQQLIQLICSPPKESWAKHFQILQEMINLRMEKKKKYGVEYTEMGKLLIPGINQLINLFKKVKSNVVLQIEQQEPEQQIIKLLISIRQNPKSTKQLLDAKITHINELISVRSKKQVQVYKNYLNFLEMKKEVKPIAERVFRLNNLDNPDIQMLITQNNCLIYVHLQLMRSITPSKSIKIIQKLPQNQAKLLFHLFWFICLRIITSCDDGMDLKLYLRLKESLHFIYFEIDGAQNYRLTEQELTLSSIQIIKTYNKIYKQKFIPEDKIKSISTNCQRFKNHLRQIDSTFQRVLSVKIYIKTLTQLAGNMITTKQEKQFRQQFNLDSDKFQDQVSENLLLIFYHFRNNSKDHELIAKSLEDMVVEKEDMLSGRDSFFKNYYDHAHPPKNIIEKIWKKITQ